MIDFPYWADDKTIQITTKLQWISWPVKTIFSKNGKSALPGESTNSAFHAEPFHHYSLSAGWLCPRYVCYWYLRTPVTLSSTAVSWLLPWSVNHDCPRAGIKRVLSLLPKELSFLDCWTRTFLEFKNIFKDSPKQLFFSRVRQKLRTTLCYASSLHLWCSLQPFPMPIPLKAVLLSRQEIGGQSWYFWHAHSILESNDVQLRQESELSQD